MICRKLSVHDKRLSRAHDNRKISILTSSIKESKLKRKTEKMCSFNCARSFLFVLSGFFTLAGGALLGLGIFGQVHKPLYGKHLLQSHFDKLENGGASKEQIDRISLYFTVVTGVSIGLGFHFFVAGISGLVGACQNFRVVSRYGFKVGFMNIKVSLIALKLLSTCL